MKVLIHGYGGGNYRRFAEEAATREEIHKALDRALDKGYTSVTITVEAEKP